MLSGKATEVGFVAADIRDVNSVRAAFNASWPTENRKGTTVIHSAAGMRYFERHESLVYRSAGLNIDGARNVLNVAQETPGVDIFLFTSSGSIPIPRTNFWGFPWNPKGQVQVVHDLDPQLEKHEEFFSNYSYTKFLAETLVRKADNPKKGFRTGCLRPGSAIYGAGGDLMAGAYLKKGVNPSWIRPIIQSMAYVENVSYAHLVYEARLIEAQTAPADAPIQKLGGDCFLITNTGDPISYGDLYFALNTLTDGRATFPIVPAGPMFLLAHLIEFYHLLQSRLTFLPPLQGDIINLQPSLFSLVTVHVKLDDSRARLPPSEGGLGYQAPWTTLDGVCQLVSDHLKEEAEEAKDKKANGTLASKIPSVTIPELSSELRHR
ncbi:hypothetical protein NLJ89_g1642 [Agrocybe chaxingu]|uniref:3-beta hydroxysteroid dehydrogenase/isomerase domain-containing protein n=1 Tax=Agrocybe chaxingu TaxID=84603 RepID=A0A9W8TEW6_9AGAR|nr:hypothetical protein NLJ89_g1642 [Agrocybe chaxingu]